MIVPTLEELAARVFDLEKRVKLGQMITTDGPGGISIELKGGVSILNLQPQMVLATLIVAAKFAQYTGVLTITSGDDGLNQQPPVHSGKSLHWRGQALDYRTRHLPDSIALELAKQVENALGVHFDVIVHIEPGKQHLHVEYDAWDPGQAPKRPAIESRNVLANSRPIKRRRES